MIGISLSLTGDFGDTGKAAERGYELWADQVNKSGGILGRQVQLKIVDDTTSATQVVTNYQSLITQDHVDLVFGPVSSLLTVPAARVAARYGYAFLEPAGGAQTVFDLHLHNLFLAQASPVLNLGQSFVDYILSLPAAAAAEDRRLLKRRQPVRLPGGRPRPAAASGGRHQDSADPDLPVGAGRPGAGRGPGGRGQARPGGRRHPGRGRLRDGQGLRAAEVQPQVPLHAERRLRPGGLPRPGGDGQRGRHLYRRHLVAAGQGPGERGVHQGLPRRYGGTADQIDPTSAEAYTCGELLQEVAAKTGSVSNAAIISALHAGTFSTIEGTLSWNADGATDGHGTLLLQWVNHELVPVYPAAAAAAPPLNPKPAWGA